jgi:hypothetical protein
MMLIGSPQLAKVATAISSSEWGREKVKILGTSDLIHDAMVTLGLLTAGIGLPIGLCASAQPLRRQRRVCLPIPQPRLWLLVRSSKCGWALESCSSWPWNLNALLSILSGIGDSDWNAENDTRCAPRLWLLSPNSHAVGCCVTILNRKSTINLGNTDTSSVRLTICSPAATSLRR